MDLKITGAFIKEQRKASGLTQAELAEKLSVTEKAVSKWECGKSFPDVSIMLPLCEVLSITANELLSAKKLNDDEYKSQAELNIVELKTKQQHSDEFTLKIEIVLGIASAMTMIIPVMFIGLTDAPLWLKIVLAAIGFIAGLTGLFFCMVIEKDVGYYECPHCGKKHIPSLKAALFSMHAGRTKYLKCPLCHKKGWNKKVIK